jgi:shikimate kinase
MKNIILVGFMGSGKTSIGREIANVTGLKYVDIDDMIVKEAKMPIKSIFAKRGEDGFRDIEKRVVIKAAKMKNVVIATGGGVVKIPDNVRTLRKSGNVVYLKTGFDTIVDRIKGRDDRPLFDMNNIKGTRKLYTDRLPVYRKSAHITVITDKNSVKQVAKKIIDRTGL